MLLCTCIFIFYTTMSECMIFYGPTVPEINYSILFYKTASNVCEIFVKLFHNFIFVCIAGTFRSYKLIIYHMLLFFDFNTSFIEFHVFLQSFLYNSNLFLKCIFFDCLIIMCKFVFISFICSLVFNCRILLKCFE